MVQFDRPIGAQADAKELEYISALHQTGARLRPDGSIRDEDIKAFLRSRFGIEVTLDEVRQTILQGLGGSDGEGEVIDLMELTAIILIPLLLKAAALEKGQKLPAKTVPPPEELLGTALSVILHDVTGKYDAAQELSPDLVKQILTIYGETEMAKDEALIQEMIQAANGSSGMGGEFNVLAFAEALTNDVQLYDIAHESRVSTSMQDVFDDDKVASAEPTSNAPSDSTPGTDGRSANPPTRQANTLIHKFTAPAIDIQAGTYRSKALAVCLWGSVLFGSFSIALKFGSANHAEGCLVPIDSELGWVDNMGAIVCKLLSSIVGWLIVFSVFAFIGMFSIGLGSLGNYIGHTRWYLPLIGGAFILSYGFVLDDDQRVEQSISYFRYMTVMSQILSCLTAYFHLCNFTCIVFRNVKFHETTWGRLLGLAPLGREADVKSAGAYKANRLVSNAMTLMKSQASSSVFKTYFGQGLSAYAVNGVNKEKTGGFLWMWRSVLDRSIFQKEGIWYSTRLVASNFTQLAVCIFILLLGISTIQDVKGNYGIEKATTQVSNVIEEVIETSISNFQAITVTTELTNVFTSYLVTLENSGFFDCTNTTDGAAYVINELCQEDLSGSFNCSSLATAKDSLCLLIENPDLIQTYPETAFQLLETSQFNTTYMYYLVRSKLEGVVNDALASLYPEKANMLMVPLCIAVAVAVMAALRLAIFYLPSVTTTILELRSGVIPSLQSPEFEKYRVAPYTVTILTGSLFWGCLVSSLLLGSLMGAFAFLILWQGSAFLVMQLFAIVVGVVCILIIKTSFVHCCCGIRFYKALYRSKPAASNISLLALEWADFVFTIAFIIVRMFKILLISAASIGQIDRRLLAEGVGQLGPIEFDPYPTIHVIELVSQEAHRHPYIEILGTMYLMKLRYSRHFGSRAGSAWRLVFIYALLPWMHQYRIYDGEVDFADVLKRAEPSLQNIGDLGWDGMVATGATRLSSLEASSAKSTIDLEQENIKLKKKVKRLSEQLRELHSSSPSEVMEDNL